MNVLKNYLNTPLVQRIKKLFKVVIIGILILFISFKSLIIFIRLNLALKNWTLKIFSGGNFVSSLDLYFIAVKQLLHLTAYVLPLLMLILEIKYKFITSGLHILKPWLFTQCKNIYHNFIKLPKRTRIKILSAPIILILLIFSGIKLYTYIKPPKVLYSFPEANSPEIPLTSSIEIVFDKPMSARMVERSFMIVPNTQGTFEWEANQKLIFKPQEQLERNKKYKVTIGGSALSKSFTPMFKKYTFTFNTIGNPKVIVTSPSTEALEANSPITVIFDRPMIPLTTAREKEQLASPIKLDPDIPGNGNWLGTTAYQFKPLEPYKKGTQYTITVLKGLKSVDGGVFEQDYTWAFTGELPKLIKTEPKDGELYSNPSGLVKLTFSQPIKLDSLAERFEYTDHSGNKIAGTFSTDIKDPNTYIFKPDNILTRETTYNFRIKQGILGLEGPVGSETEVVSKFTTAPFPKILSTSPTNNSSGVKELYTVEVYFKSPMNQDSLEQNLIISPTPESSPSVYFYTGQNKLHINTYLQRSTAHTIYIKGSARDIHGTALGSDYKFSFYTAPYDPSVSIEPQGTYFASFNQEIKPIVISKVTNAQKLNYSLYKLTTSQYIHFHKLIYDYQYSQNFCKTDRLCRNWQSFNKQDLTLVNEWSEEIDQNLNVPVNVISRIVDKNGSPLPAGTYLLDISLQNGTHDNIILTVSRASLTVKYGPDQVLVWAVDQNTGDVIEDMNIEFYDPKGVKIGEGKTDKDGIWIEDIDLYEKNQNYDYNKNYYVTAKKSDDELIMSTLWDEGINRYDFNIPNISWGENSSHKLHITLDNYIFRPGNKINFKGVLRRDNGGRIEGVSSGELVNVKALDPKGNTIYTENIPVNAFGTFWGNLSISDSADLGYYTITANYQHSEFRQSFQVEEFKKPEYLIDIKPSKEYFSNRESAYANINVSYYFGAPLTNQDVKWSIKRRDSHFTWNKDYGYSFEDSDDVSFWHGPNWDNDNSSGEEITQGSGKTDLLGDMSVQIPSNISEYNSSQIFVIEASTQDESNVSVASSKEFTVHRGNIYVGIKPEAYTNTQGKDAPLSIVTINPLGQEQPNKEVDIKVFKRTWNIIRERDPETQRFFYKNEPNDILYDNFTLITDELGYAKTSFIPESGGTYKILATVEDNGGNLVQASTLLWVAGEDFESPRQNHDRIELITDKYEYNVNDNISILANSPYDKAIKSLVTVEREGVLEYKIAEMGGSSTGTSIKVKDTFTPNAFVSVLIPKSGNSLDNPPEFKIGYTKVLINNPQNKLTIKISTDKSVYSPKDTMKINVNTKDLKENNIKSEVLIAVVDKAVWDIANVSSTDIFKNFYQERSLLVHTANLLTKSMDRINANVNLGSKGGSGGGGGGDIFFDSSRTQFLNTALWKPDLYTDENGNAAVEVQLPDNLTTWKVFAVAVSKDKAVGENSISVLTSKDVIIRPFLPRFLSTGDKSNLGAIVVNTNDQTQDLKIKMETGGLLISDNKEKELRLEPGQQEKVLWNTEATASESFNIGFQTLHKSSNKTADAIQVQIPVTSYFTRETVATAGKVNGTATESIKLSKEIVKEMGSLDISLSPIMGISKLNTANEILSFPYSCGEQISSRLITSSSLFGIMNNTSLDQIGTIKKDKLKESIQLEVQAIYRNQNLDGGWSWWPTQNSTIRSNSDPFITAYTYNALKQASEAGFEISPLVLDKAHNFLRNVINTDIPIDTLSYILYTLRSEGFVTSYANKLWEKRFLLTVDSRALLAITLKEQAPSLGKKLHDEVISLVKKTGTTSHWEERVKSYYTMGSDNNTTATVILMMLAYNKNNPLIEEAIRYIETTNTFADSTKTNARIVESIAQYTESQNVNSINKRYKIELNGATKKEGDILTNNILNYVENKLSISELITNESNTLNIYESGKGNLYYNMNLTYFLPFEETQPLEQGFTIIRELIDSDGNLINKDNVHEGDDLWVKLQIVVPEVRRNIIIEDILPAGMESVNKRLKNANILTQDKPTLEENNSYDEYYFSKTEFRDDKTVFFSDRLSPGVYELVYKAKATIPGSYHYPPAQIREMYVPDISGHSSGGWINIKERD